MATRHYSSSKLVDWIRERVFKFEKPAALPMADWGKWRKDTKKAYPVGWFVTETFPDLLEKIPEHSIDYVNEVRYFISNWRGGTHRLDSTLSVGKWHEYSERMLYSCFDSFVDHIEIDEAYSHIAWRNKDEMVKYHVPWYAKSRWFRWGQKWRCPQAGIDHLKWEMTLDIPDPNDPNWLASPHQAQSAREKMELYIWWKNVRPLRGDPWKASGFDEFWEKMSTKYKDNGDVFTGWLGLSGKSKMTPAEQREYNRLSEHRDSLEEQWKQEDTEMLVRLVKMRDSLWT